MTPTKFFCLLLIPLGFSLFGCSSTDSGEVNIQPETPPPVVVAPEPEPEIIPEPEIVEPEPPKVEEPVIEEVIVEVEPVPVEPEVAEPETITVLGFIKYVELEGGFFGIMTEDGSKYFPEYLEQEFKVDGLKVRLLAKPQEQILGIQMWGTPIEILKIEAN